MENYLCSKVTVTVFYDYSKLLIGWVFTYIHGCPSLDNCVRHQVVCWLLKTSFGWKGSI